MYIIENLLKKLSNIKYKFSIKYKYKRIYSKISATDSFGKHGRKNLARFPIVINLSPSKVQPRVITGDSIFLENADGATGGTRVEFQTRRELVWSARGGRAIWRRRRMTQKESGLFLFNCTMCRSVSFVTTTVGVFARFTSSRLF